MMKLSRFSYTVTYSSIRYLCGTRLYLDAASSFELWSVLMPRGVTMYTVLIRHLICDPGGIYPTAVYRYAYT